MNLKIRTAKVHSQFNNIYVLFQFDGKVTDNIRQMSAAVEGKKCTV